VCLATWNVLEGRTCWLWHLSSDPVCMAALMHGFSSSLLGVISGTQHKIICLFVFVPYLYWFCIFAWVATLQLSCSVVSSNASVHLLSAGSAFLIFLSLELCYKLASHNFFKHFVCCGHAGFSALCISGLFFSPKTFWEVPSLDSVVASHNLESPV
jgi:hypothetical protein